MPPLRVLIEKGELCQRLAEKRLFYQTPGDETDIAGAGPFWCARTQGIYGPDGGLVDTRTCKPGRECFETP